MTDATTTPDVCPICDRIACLCLNLDPIEARARAATEEAPAEWHQGYAWKDAVLVAYDKGIAGPGGERVLLRANEHFQHEKVIAHVGGMSPATTLALTAEVRRLRAMIIARGAQ